MSNELLVKGGHVVTADPDLGGLPVGDVLAVDEVITPVGRDLRPATENAKVIDVGFHVSEALDLMYQTRDRLRSQHS